MKNFFNWFLETIVTLLDNFFNFLIFGVFQHCDAPRAWGLYFQDSASPQMEALIELHDNIMYYLTIIFFSVSWIFISIVRNYVSNKSAISNKSWYINRINLNNNSCINININSIS